MSNARILADLMGTSTTVPSSKLSLAAGDLPSDTVLQTKTFTTSTTVNLTSSYQDVISCAMTPTNSTSKMLITVYAPVYMPADTGMAVKLVRGSTDIYDPNAISGGNPYYHYEGTGGSYNSLVISYLDTHSSSSAITYKLQAKEYNANNQQIPQQSAGGAATLSVTIQEIAG